MHGSRRYPTPCRKGSGPWSDKLEVLRLSLRERNADEVMAPGNRASVAARVAQRNREARARTTRLTKGRIDDRASLLDHAQWPQDQNLP